ncbi:anti-phage deoxyguanosine triphosphatase [uncultured Ferrimonas sp.]|uniref:anti-phage deoxyguanosine triphosphatase n=1 Tax=uncultured Ferrimonas sp. TaxID=432640 RepID=UPI0026358AA5|nr:anti-phage deoxyguanosine triphosphatase [uncultured Ferrimonas sp.]
MTAVTTDWQQRRLPGNSSKQQDQRSRFQRDKARVLHSAAFRRLQSKTQVLGIGLNDFHRTRLTHSIESAQIGSGINAQLRNRYPHLAPLFDDQLIEALCLAHDIGHPPYGHGGEVALNYMMRDHGGFEGNGQTFRILAKLEPYTESHGMNLTRRTLLGVLKYPVLQSKVQRLALPPAHSSGFLHTQSWLPAKAIFDDDLDIYNWVLQPLNEADREHFLALRQAPTAQEHGRSAAKSLDCTIMELADDIAYSVHDLEDAIVLGIITQPQWQQQVIDPLSHDPLSPYTPKQLASLTQRLFASENHHRKKAIGALVNGFVTAIEVRQHNQFCDPLLAYQAGLPDAFSLLLDCLKQFVYRNVILHSSVQRQEFKGQQVVMALFSALASEPERLLPSGTKLKWQQAQQQGDQRGYRVLSDYLSGMTDDFAAKLHHDLFSSSPRSGDFHSIE